jgi:hypothetical protein
MWSLNVLITVQRDLDPNEGEILRCNNSTFHEETAEIEEEWARLLISMVQGKIMMIRQRSGDQRE